MIKMINFDPQITNMVTKMAKMIRMIRINHSSFNREKLLAGGDEMKLVDLPAGCRPLSSLNLHGKDSVWVDGNEVKLEYFVIFEGNMWGVANA